MAGLRISLLGAPNLDAFQLRRGRPCLFPLPREAEGDALEGSRCQQDVIICGVYSESAEEE